MIRSMTGFASISREDGANRVGVTVKSVNHRFLDVQVKMPGTLAAIDGRVKSLVQQRLTRGRVEVAVSLDITGGASCRVVLNDALLTQIAGVLDDARRRGLVTGDLTVGDLIRLPHVLEIASGDEPSAPDDAALALVDLVVGDAIDALAVMRATEGGILQRDLAGRIATLMEMVDAIQAAARAGQASLDGRLTERIAQLAPDLRSDPAALAQEVVRFVARSDIDEELVRLRGHVEHWRALAASPEPCGRKLDFLVQEMNREINTIGSKADGGRATELVIAAKAELERLREQVQNVE